MSKTNKELIIELYDDNIKDIMHNIGAGMVKHIDNSMAKEIEDMFMDTDLNDIQELVGGLAKQVAGNHYSKHTIQPWDIIKEYDLDYWEGNVIKYICRAKDKNGKEDLEKALHYLEYIIENYDEKSTKV